MCVHQQVSYDPVKKMVAKKYLAIVRRHEQAVKLGRADGNQVFQEWVIDTGQRALLSEGRTADLLAEYERYGVQRLMTQINQALLEQGEKRFVVALKTDDNGASFKFFLDLKG